MASSSAVSQQVPFRQVDVFTTTPFQGNPLAVIVDASTLSDTQMQHIAHWTNLSETTFVFPPTVPGAHYKVRIFSVNTEFQFAGHPTLGTCSALVNAGLVHPGADGIVTQECGVGLVPVRVDGKKYSFRAPAVRSPIKPIPFTSVEQAFHHHHHPSADGAHSTILRCRGEPCVIDIGIRWLICFLERQEDLLSLVPDGQLLHALCKDVGADGVTLFAPKSTTNSTTTSSNNAANGVDSSHDDDEYTFELRTFLFENNRVIEDPVCGSANACVARYLAAEPQFSSEYRIKPGATYVACQGTKLHRSGRIFVEYVSSPDGVLEPWVGGYVSSVVEGHINLQ